MRAVIKNVFLVLAVVLLNSVSSVGHTSAASTMSHELSGMNHGSLEASSCSTQCRTAVVSKEENIINKDESEDDYKLAAQYYSQSQLLRIDEKIAAQSLYATKIKPPPKIPLYIFYNVFIA